MKAILESVLFLFIMVLALGIVLPKTSSGYDVRINGERLSLRADDEPLQTVLRGFADAGVLVKVDPGVQQNITAHIENTDIDKALARVLSPLGYVLIWDVVRSPMGNLPKLSEIHVFQKGHEQSATMLYSPKQDSRRYARTSSGAEYIEDELLLTVRPGTSLEDFKRLLAQIGGTVVECIPELGVYRVRFPAGTNIPALASQLEKNQLLNIVGPNYVVSLQAPQELPEGAASSAASARILTKAAGDNTLLAVLDSGLAQRAELAQLVVGQCDALHPDQNITDPVGHGTQMAMIAAGAVSPAGITEGTDSTGVPILAIRAFDPQGKASDYELMRGFKYAIDNGARVANLSWGTENNSTFMARIISYAQSKGVIIVAAAGNEPTGKPVYPAAYPGVICVGATKPDGELWEKSNRGNFVTLTAPGFANLPVGYNGPPGSYGGTSIASAYVAKIITKYVQKHPSASNSEITAAVNKALSKSKESGTGNGTLDDAAISRLLK